MDFISHIGLKKENFIFKIIWFCTFYNILFDGIAFGSYGRWLRCYIPTVLYQTLSVGPSHHFFSTCNLILSGYKSRSVCYTRSPTTPAFCLLQKKYIQFTKIQNLLFLFLFWLNTFMNHDPK